MARSGSRPTARRVAMEASVSAAHPLLAEHHVAQHPAAGCAPAPHRGQTRRRATCSMTSTGAGGMCSTCRRRTTSPPRSAAPQSGHAASACSTVRVGTSRRRPNPCPRRLRAPLVALADRAGFTNGGSGGAGGGAGGDPPNSSTRAVSAAICPVSTPSRACCASTSGDQRLAIQLFHGRSVQHHAHSVHPSGQFAQTL